MADAAPLNLSGSTFGSFAWLYLGTVVPCVGFFLIVGFLERNAEKSGVLVVGSAFGLSGFRAFGLSGFRAFGLSVGCHLVQRVSTIMVSETGVAYRCEFAPGVRTATIDVVLPWENIQSIREHRFSASMVLIAPQRKGLFNHRKLRFAYLDPQWRTRPTSAEILSRCR